MPKEKGEVKDLILVTEETKLAELFSVEGEILAIVSRIEEEVKSHVIDVKTAEGRRFAKQLAAKVSASKTLLEKARKDCTESWRKKTTEANKIGKETVERLDALRDKTKAPVLEWEATETARVEGIQFRMAVFEPDQLTAQSPAADIEALIIRINEQIVDGTFEEFREEAEADKVEALKVYGSFLQVAQAREKKEAEDAAEIEAMRAENAALKAKQEERDKAEAERLAAEQKKADDLAAAKQADENLKAATQKALEDAEREKQEAEKRHQQELEDAKREAEQKVADERARVQQEKDDKAEQERKDLADREKRADVVNKIAADLKASKCATLYEIAHAIVDGKIANVKVVM